MDNRPRFDNIETAAFYPISTFEDLRETLTLMERGGSNVRPYIAEWYNKVFIPAFEESPEEPNSKGVEKGGKETTLQEDRKGLTSNELAEKTKEVLKIPKPSADEMLKKYLYPLLNQGIIDKVQSQLNKNNNLYFPSDEEQTGIFSLFANKDQGLKLEVDPEYYPDSVVVEHPEKHHAKGEVEKNEKYRLEGPDGQEMSLKELVERYLSNPEICFEKKLIFSGGSPA